MWSAYAGIREARTSGCHLYRGDGSPAHRRADLTIEANSEKILQDRLTAGSIPATFDSLNETDSRLVKVIDDLRAHTRLLGRYFTAFHQLATSDSPERVAGSLQSTATKLNGLSTQLGQQRILSGQGLAVGSALAELAVQQRIRASLRRELAANQMTVRTALSTQKRLLDLLAERIEDDLRDLRERRQQRLLNEPLADGAIATRANQDKWIGERHALLTKGHGVASDLQTAA